jgi:hypothetical protein
LYPCDRLPQISAVSASGSGNGIPMFHPVLRCPLVICHRPTDLAGTRPHTHDPLDDPGLTWVGKPRDCLPGREPQECVIVLWLLQQAPAEHSHKKDSILVEVPLFCRCKDVLDCFPEFADLSESIAHSSAGLKQARLGEVALRSLPPCLVTHFTPTRTR